MLEDYKLLADKVRGADDSFIQKALDTSDKKVNEDLIVPWVSHNFEHLPLMSVMCQLTNILVNVRLVEGELLSRILAAEP